MEELLRILQCSRYLLNCLEETFTFHQLVSVADGAAKQAAWALSGKDEVPNWSLGEIREIAPKNPGPEIVEDYLEQFLDQDSLEQSH